MTYLIDSTVIDAFDHSFSPNLRLVSCCVAHLCDAFVLEDDRHSWKKSGGPNVSYISLTYNFPFLCLEVALQGLR